MQTDWDWENVKFGIDVTAEEIETSDVTIGHPVEGGPGDVLRWFTADVEFADIEAEAIGTVTGWVTWNVEGVDLADAGDRIDSFTYLLGAAAQDIRTRHNSREFVVAVLMLAEISVPAPFRRGDVTEAVLADLMRVFTMPADATIVIACPDPIEAYRGTTFKPWQPEKGEWIADVWWRPLPVMEL